MHKEADEKEMKRQADAYLKELQERAAKRDHLGEVLTQFDGERFRWLATGTNFMTASKWDWTTIVQLRHLIDAELLKEANRGSPS